MQLSRPLVLLLNRFQPSAETVMLVLAIVVGLLSGTGVTLFRKLILFAQQIYWHDLAVVVSAYSPIAIVLVPILGALVVSLLRLQLEQVEKVAGGSETHKDASKSDHSAKQETRKLPFIQAPLKTIAAAFSLGAGASLGPEGPSVELGSNIGSMLGQSLKFSSERTRLLLSAGGAAGLSAGFNAPIAGVFFALEVLLRDSFGTKSSLNSDISVVVIAAVVSALVAQIGLGEQPAFSLPVYEVRSYWELPLYMGLGVLASLVAIAYTRSLKFAKRIFAGEVAKFEFMAAWSVPSKLVLGGLIVGLVALFFPEAIGIGYETVESILQDAPFTVPLLLILLVTKLGLTAISLGSGFVGGIFAPSIFLGAVLGSAYGQIMAAIMPASIPVAASPAYALVGMAAVLAGSVKAPLTSVLLLFEMTRDYRIVLPLMASVGLCAWLSEQMMQTSPPYSFSAQLSESQEAIDVLAKIKIAEVMTLNPPSVRYSMSLLQAAQIITSGYYHSAVVVDEANHLIGILTTQDVKRVLSLPDADSQLDKLTVEQVCTKEVVHTYVDESLSEALRRMAARDLRQLPVVDRNAVKRVIGLVDRQAITTAYNTALTKQAIADRITANKIANTSTNKLDNKLDKPESKLNEKVEDLIVHPVINNSERLKKQSEMPSILEVEVPDAHVPSQDVTSPHQLAETP
ncbi:chloride channel protein [Tumidithrix elongata RA019]|uniref:Chloride channel protein n=1 Tax=Tumidithrix elongata BACA0141 TaxID=2716417 RepID=A0AAW9PYY0_9CYAN|nr:chloride channel protein [Tumidithrix elongata RA019]